MTLPLSAQRRRNRRNEFALRAPALFSVFGLCGVCGVSQKMLHHALNSSTFVGSDFLAMTTNSWDIQLPGHLDLTADETYTAVGQALSAWENMEHYFARIFGFFTSGDDTFVAERAYGAVISFNGRNELLSSAAEAYFYTRPAHKMEKRFDDLRKLTKKYSPRRNEIAHGLVQQIALDTPRPPGMDAVTHFKQTTRYLLLPPEYATNKNTLTPLKEDGSFPPYRTQGRYAYSSREIRAYSDHFTEIRASLAQMIEDWWDQYPGEAPEPPT